MYSICKVQIRKEKLVTCSRPISLRSNWTVHVAKYYVQSKFVCSSIDSKIILGVVYVIQY